MTSDKKTIERKEKNLYAVIGVKPTATQKQIKDAFIKKSKQLHPDKQINSPSGHAEFLSLNYAYKILSKPTTRAQHDIKLTSNKLMINSPSYGREIPKYHYCHENKTYSDPGDLERIHRLQDLYGGAFWRGTNNDVILRGQYDAKPYYIPIKNSSISTPVKIALLLFFVFTVPTLYSYKYRWINKKAEETELQCTETFRKIKQI